MLDPANTLAIALSKAITQTKKETKMFDLEKRLFDILKGIAYDNWEEVRKLAYNIDTKSSKYNNILDVIVELAEKKLDEEKNDR